MQAKHGRAVLGFWLVLTFATAADWPQWLGPQRTGISSERGPARLLPRPERVWTNFVGLGCSSFAIAQNRAYTLGHIKQGRNRGTDTLYCLDGDTGRVIWQYCYECASCISQDVKFDGPRSTPLVDGGCVYSLSVEGHLFCLEAASGNVLWARQLTQDLEGRTPVYGYCCSPLVHENHLILELNAPEASYVALDKRTGAVVWRLARGQVTCGSPVLTRVDGLDWVVFAGGGAIVAADAVTGRELWRHRTWGHAWMGPVVWSNLVFMANASLPRGCGLIEVNNLRPTVLWEDKTKFQTLHCNAVLWEGHLYGTDNTGTDYQGADSKKSVLKCLEAKTGQVKWAKENVGWGNLIVFDRKLFLVRETGELIVAQASPDRYEELLRAELITGPTWSSPALAQGRLYCRSKTGQAVCARVVAREDEPASAEPGGVRLAPAPERSREDSGGPSRFWPGRGKGEAEAALSWLGDTAREQWPRFRGPGGLGVATLTNTPTSWNGQTGAGIRWKVRVPLPGPSSPIAWGKRLFLTGADRNRREVYCYDTDSGELLWHRQVPSAPASLAEPEPDTTDKALAASTPVTDGCQVQALFGTGELACFDFEGNLIWYRHLESPQNSYGHAASLERWRDLLLIQLDQAEVQEGKSKLLALNAGTGRTVWETKRLVPASWSTPVAAHLGGRDLLLTCADPWVAAYDVRTGDELWRCQSLTGEVVASPIHAAGLVLAGTSDGRFAAIRPDGSGDVTSTHTVWSVEDNVPSICSPVSQGGLVFLLNSGGLVVCHDLEDGRKVWERDFGVSFLASPTIAGDRLYLLSDYGEMFILRAGRTFELLNRAPLGEGCEASPAFQAGRIYLRSKQSLFGVGADD